MYNNEFFVVDMSSCTSTGEIINSLSLALETLNHTGKKIVLKLNNGYLNQSQMLSIQSLITSYGCTLDTVETVNKETAEIAENMNILVQEPIEKRIEEKYGTNEENSYDTYINEKENQDESIAVKDVTGLYFEADLDAIQRQQDNINIASDLREAGISPKSDFNEIKEAIYSKYNMSPQDVGEHDLTTPVGLDSSDFSPSSSVPHEEDTQENNQIDNNDNNIINNQTDLNNDSRVVSGESLENNSMGVYKKAYDEFSSDCDDWEEVVFYETPTDDPVVSDSKATMYINQTLRSGQVIESEGNIVVIGDCHPGSEIRAVGDITVWGILSGIAHAGCKGNINSKIRALKMNAVQLRIASCYSRRPDSTNIPYVLKTSVFTPEEARAVDNEIMLFKINQN